MNHDSPDTILMDETQWADTDMDDLFQPSVRVQLGWREVDAAVRQGAIVPRQAHALWASWASPSSALRVGATGVAPAFESGVAERTRGETAPGAKQRRASQTYGPLLGLVAGAVLGAALTYWALG